MNIVLYRYVPAPLRDALIAGRLTAADHERINLVNERLQQLQYSAGRSYVSRTTLDASDGSDRSARVVALRAVLANPFTTEADVRAVIEEQAAIGASQSDA
jgi:glutamate decarboxylase